MLPLSCVQEELQAVSNAVAVRKPGEVQYNIHVGPGGENLSSTSPPMSA